MKKIFATALAAATLILGAGAGQAATVEVTIDFGTGDTVSVPSPYIEDGFELAGSNLLLSGFTGNPVRSIALDAATPSLTLTRTGGGAFSLVSFDYSCGFGTCDFDVDDTVITTGSTALTDFATFEPTSGFTDITSLLFSVNGIAFGNRIDNIVLSYDDSIDPIPLPAALPMLVAALGGLGLMRRRRRS